ncbi:MAG: hypothetical protein QOG65_1903 [Actinomycetota bacterium]|nr:hypothetical protein [Actinomycetota bacterium]
MVRAWAGTAVVLVVPGAIAAYALRLRFRCLSTWAAIPGFSLAVIFVIAEAVDLVRLPFNLASASVAAVALAGAAFAWQRRRPFAPLGERVPTASSSGSPAADAVRADELDDPSTLVAKRLAAGLLAVGIGAAVLIFLLGISGHALVPPEIDASNHGFFVARVLHSSSVDVSKVVVSDPSGTYGSAAFYPLGAHAAAALAVRLAGADVGRVLVVFDIAFASIVLPLGMYVLARTLARKKPLVAGFAALAVPALVLFPFGSIGYGDVPLVMGMALVPISVVFLRRALTESGDTRRLQVEAVIAGGLLLFAATVVHTSQVPLILMFVVLLVLEDAWRSRSTSAIRASIKPGVAIAAVVLLLAAPTLKLLVSGVSERSSITLATRLSTATAVGRIVTLQIPQTPTRQPAFAVLALVGIVIWLWRRRPAWVLAYAIVLGITLLVWVSDNWLSKLLGVPWYHSTARLGFNQAFFVPFFAGVALAALVDVVVRSSRSVSPRILIGSCVAVAVLFGAVVGYDSSRSSTDLLRTLFEADARVTPDSNAAFAFLRRRIKPDEVVVNDINADGSLWMYAQADLRPLFAVHPISSDRAALADWDARTYLVKHIDDLDVDLRADALRKRYHAGWVYFDEQLFDLFHHTMQLDTLKHDPRLHLAFERGTVHVFRILDGPGTSPT